MISINQLSPDNKPYPITHKCKPEKAGEPMTKQEIHEFGLGFLIVYLYKQKGNLISANDHIATDYPHLVAKNPKKELLYIWVKTEIAPFVPRYIPNENHEDIIKLAKQFNSMPVFAGIMLTCDSTEENRVPKCGMGYFAKFTGFKEI